MALEEKETVDNQYSRDSRETSLSGAWKVCIKHAWQPVWDLQ